MSNRILNGFLLTLLELFIYGLLVIYGNLTVRFSNCLSGCGNDGCMTIIASYIPSVGIWLLYTTLAAGMVIVISRLMRGMNL